MLSYAALMQGSEADRRDHEVSAAVASERARILAALDALVNINPGAVVTWPDGKSAEKAECDRALFDTFRRIVDG